MPPTTAHKPAHIAWIHRAKQHCFSRAAVPARDAAAQCIKAVHINAGTFVQLLGPSPLELHPAATTGLGAAMAPPIALRLWPKVPLRPKDASSLWVRLPLNPARLGAGLQSIAIDWALQTVAGRWPGCAREPAAPPSWQEQVSQRGLLVLPEWALEWGAARATGWGLHPVAAGLTTAAALCPKLATCLRVLGDVHRALCAWPLAVGALILGLTVDFWLIAWRAYQGTARSTESYLYAPCAPPEPPRGCWRASGPSVLEQQAPPHEGAEAKAARKRAKLLRLHVHTFLNLEPLLQSDLQLRGLFFEHVRVTDYIRQTEAWLLQADTPEFRHLFLDSVNYARTEGPKVEALGERWLAAPKLLPEHTMPVSGDDNAEFRNKHLWVLKQAFNLLRKDDCRLPWLSLELRDAMHPKDYKERVAQRYVGSAKRRRQLAEYRASMKALLPDLQACWRISTMQGKEASLGLLEMLQKDQAFFDMLIDCAKEIGRQLSEDDANKRQDADRLGLELSLRFWKLLSGDEEFVLTPKKLLLTFHPDKILGRRDDFAEFLPEQTLTDEAFAALIKKANPLFDLMNTLYKAATEAKKLKVKLPLFF